MSTADSPERDTPSLAGAPPRILVIQAPYYRVIVDGMRRAAEQIFAELHATVDVADVAGAFELPAALRMALSYDGGVDRKLWDGYLILGCVVKGDTDHYDHICRETCRGVMDIAVETGAPIGFGLLTVHTIQQAEERAAPGRMNKGAEAAHAVLGQIALARRWGLA